MKYRDLILNYISGHNFFKTISHKRGEVPPPILGESIPQTPFTSPILAPVITLGECRTFTGLNIKFGYSDEIFLLNKIFTFYGGINIYIYIYIYRAGNIQVRP